jgi:hypothetical protein
MRTTSGRRPQRFSIPRAYDLADEWPPEFQPEASRVERVEIDGEPILACLTTRRGVETLEVVFRFEEREGRIARVRIYSFCPETMRAAAERLGLPVRTGLYRAPTPAPAPSSGTHWRPNGV